MLSVCCLSGRPARLAALLPLLRPVADEIVVAVDDRADLRLLGESAELVDRLFTVPYADPVERSLQWLHEQTTGDSVFRIDDDEVPSRALLDLLASPPDNVTHCHVPRRWLWRDGWLDGFPWRPDWQLRLARREAVVFPGVVHVPVSADGPALYAEAPLYHFDLLLADRDARVAKARRYEQARPGLRLGGLPLNIAYYVPDDRDVRVAPVPEEDRALVDAATRENTRPLTEAPPAQRATRQQVDTRWADRPLPDSAYQATIEVTALDPFAAGEVRTVDVRVRNAGTETLPRELPEIRLAYRGLPSLLRTRLPHDLAPDESTLVPVSVEAPGEPGVYAVTIDLVHERHRWFGCGAEVELEVLPRRRALVFVGQAPGDPAFDATVDELLASLDAALEPHLVGPQPAWLRDRFGLEASTKPPAWRPDEVYALPAGRRRDRLRLQLTARRLQRHARR